ncbi:MAG: DNA polymerase III subunit alpha, partial [Spirosomataceae bacterium]
MQFSHLHNHTQFSLLDGASNIDRLMKKAVEDNMPAVAITDHGNMFGVFDFVAKANQHKVKPIIGCEFYVVEDHTIKQFTKEKKDRRYHQLLLAKNEQGYKNISKLCSIGYMDGLYSKYPRVTKALIEEYKENLIATTCCIGAMIPQAILRQDEATARKEFEWWYDRFGEDFYVELQRHDIPDQNTVNEVLLRFAKEYGVKVIASNDSHYVDRDDALSHDILLCVNTNEKLSTPKQINFDDDDSVSKRNTRFAFPNEEFYFKNTAEMTQRFADLPQAIDNTNEIVGKIENIDLKKDILLPNFPIPDKFIIHKEDKENQWEYLKHLTYEGAKRRYGEITEEVRERVDFELFTIKTMGFAGYFLIVMDFIQVGRDMGVLVGPGRGSAAGSVVAYCISITNIDPIKYNLLFERFLNPERLSMPDIDTDFDDDGRQKVIDYVVEKYGKHQVAQIITYGTMATKSAIKDVARVMEFPLSESNYIAKLVPDRPAYRINF